MTEENKNQQQSNTNVHHELRGSLSTKVHVHDIVIALTAILAVAGAFFMYGTRISVLESIVDSHNIRCEKCEVILGQLNNRLTRLEDKVTTLQEAFVERGAINLPILRQLQLEVQEIKTNMNHFHRYNTNRNSNKE